jgi:hypothetical protein
MLHSFVYLTLYDRLGLRRVSNRNDATICEGACRAAADVIFSQSTPSTAALLQQTRTIPIVFAVVLDPVGSGFVASFPRPGGNVTGLTNFETTVAGKWLAMLKEIAPRVTRAALVINPKTSSFAHYLREAEAMARSLAIDLTPNPIENAADIERAIESSGLIVPPDSTTVLHRDLIITLASRYRAPAVYAFRIFVAAGRLMTYGVDYVDQFRQVAPYVGRILRGTLLSLLRLLRSGIGTRLPSQHQSYVRSRRKLTPQPRRICWPIDKTLLRRFLNWTEAQMRDAVRQRDQIPQLITSQIAIVGTWLGRMRFACVLARTCSTATPGATSRSLARPCGKSITASSLTTMLTGRAEVSGAARAAIGQAAPSLPRW